MRPVRLQQAWRFWPKGHIFLQMPANQAREMIRRGQAVYADEGIEKEPAPAKKARASKRPHLPGFEPVKKNGAAS